MLAGCVERRDRWDVMKITEAVKALDPKNDAHWTADGFPRVEAISNLTRTEITRKQITDAAPNLTRASLEPKEDEAGEEPEKDDEEGRDQGAEVEEVEEDIDPVEDEGGRGAPSCADPTVADDLTAPVGDANGAAHVSIEDDVVGMTVPEVYESLELIDRAIDEFSRQATILGARREAIAEKIKEIGRRSALLSRARNKHLRGGLRDENAQALHSYLAKQNEIREGKAEKTRRFIEAGTTIENVREALTTSSKLDSSMRQRRPPRGAVRPNYPQSTP